MKNQEDGCRFSQNPQCSTDGNCTTVPARSEDTVLLPENPGPDMIPDTIHAYRVTDAPFCAKGDGKTNDRASIQAAIDAAFVAGGGTVCLPGGRTYLSGNLRMRNNVILYIEEDAILKQSNDPHDFVDPMSQDYKPLAPVTGHDVTNYEWGHAHFFNYPFIYATDAENFTITGKGIIEGSRGESCADTVHMVVIGMYHVDGFEISGITVRKYNVYTILSAYSRHGLIKNVTVKNPLDGNGDGFALIGSSELRVTGCDLTTSDDSIYVVAAYRDPRAHVWYSDNDPRPNRNIEIDHNRCRVTWDATKCLAFMSWGSACPDQRKVEISNIYVHDNDLQTLGAWHGHWGEKSFVFDGSNSPMKNIRFENNIIGTVQDNFHALSMSNVIGFDCMNTLRNTDFKFTADAWWCHRGCGGAEQVSVGEYCGYIGSLETQDSALYQGIHLVKDVTYGLSAVVESSGDTARLFVRNQASGELIASRGFNNTEWQQVGFSFSVSRSGNYLVGIERGDAKSGKARIDSISLTMTAKIPDGLPDGESLFSGYVPETAINGGGMRNQYGTIFTPKTDGEVVGVRIYTDSRERGIHYVSLWNFETRKRLTDEFYEWEILAGFEGWQAFALPQSVKLKKGLQYVVSVSAGPDCMASITNNIASAHETEYLTAPADSCVSSRNALGEGFRQMPDDRYQSNIFRDVIFVPQK